MTTAIRYVIDTHAVIWYFSELFNQSNCNSNKVNRIIDEIIKDPFTTKRLVVPSIIFVEIFDNFCHTAIDSRRIYFDCFVPLDDCDNVEIREIDKEVVDSLLGIQGELASHEINDKLIVATGLVLDRVVITKDPVIQRFAKQTPEFEAVW
jgi:PIN domain nuclease of toxin-antitoxin system